MRLSRPRRDVKHCVGSRTSWIRSQVDYPTRAVLRSSGAQVGLSSLDKDSSAFRIGKALHCLVWNTSIKEIVPGRMIGRDGTIIRAPLKYSL